MNYEDVIICELSRRDIYKCLSKCYRLPKMDLNETLRVLEQKFSELKSQVLPSAILLRKSFSDCKDLKNLRIDFAKLFVGPYSLLAPPYGSVYLEGERRIMGDSTIDVIRCYKEAGLELASTFKEAPDHIATELEYMYFLIHEEVKAIEVGSKHNFYHQLSLQQKFLNDHLNRWVGLFALTVKNKAGTGFYINLADVLAKFVADDAAIMADTVINS